MPWPAGGAGKASCVVEKNAVYYDDRIKFLSRSRAERPAECCSSCSAYNKDYAPAAPLGDDAVPLHCNLWTWCVLSQQA